MGIYDELFENKNLAARVLIPLIEFEFGFQGLDSPELVQSTAHRKQLSKIFEICKQHKWTTSSTIRNKGANLYFRISKHGFEEIYKIAGPFADDQKNSWTELIFERSGKKGGYNKNKIKTEEKVSELLNENKWFSVGEICLKLRLLPSVVREALRLLNKNGKLERKVVGKTIFWKKR